MKLSDLKGVGPVYVKKLENAGIETPMDIAVRGPVEIAEVTGMEKKTANSLCNSVRELLREEGILMGFETATEVLKRRQELEVIPTGLESFDKLLGRGVECGALTEIYGEFGSGKTQFCHVLCVMVQKHLNANALYIDTEGTFRPERIIDISKHEELDPDKILENITTIKPDSSAHQILILQDIGKTIIENNIKLMIVDSGTGLPRSNYLGRGTLSARQIELSKLMTLMNKIADTYKIAVVMTNQVLADPGQMFGDPIKAVGGHVVAHKSTYRIYFKKSGRKRIARMVDSPHHAEEEIVFQLTEGGISGLEEKK